MSREWNRGTCRKRLKNAPLLPYSPTFKIRIRFLSSLNLSIYTSLVENHQHFHFMKLLKNFGASKDFRLHPHKNFDMIKINWGCSPINMIFYSTKFTF